MAETAQMETAEKPAQTANEAPSPWAPLRIPVFRALFAAQLGSNIGNWMETVGAQWLLVEHAHASTLVALVQTANMLPFVFLALPAGVLADVFDRRRYLISVHLFLTTVSALMAAITMAGLMGPSLLLTLTFLEGAGAALAIPAWQSIVPEIVPRSELAAASALGGINQNVARAIGPAIAGMLVSRIGVGAVFAINAATFVFGIVVMAFWHRPERAVDSLGREPLLPALRAGTRYIRHSPVIRRMLLRLTLFVAPAAALWALLPVVASRLLHLGPAGYGVLLGSLGVGALSGAILLPRLRSAVSPAWLLGGASVAYAASLAVTASVANPIAVVPALVVAGGAWLTVLVNLNTSIQLFLPDWVRARGLAAYQLTFMGGQAIAAALWGLAAQHFGITPALAAAAILLAAGAVTIVWWPVYDVSRFDRSHAVYWPEPMLQLEPHPDVGPVLVTVRYSVPVERAAEFVRAMKVVERSRRRTGAIGWELYRDGADPEKFVELFTLASWEEHLRQHGARLTNTDRDAEKRARALTNRPTEIEHLFPAETQVTSAVDARADSAGALKL